MWYEQFDRLCNENATTPTAFVTNILGLSSSKVTAWKQGSIPKIEILQQIATYFNVTVGQLFDGKEKSLSPELSEDKQRLIYMYDLLNDMEKGEILVKIKAALTCGTDVKTFRRGHPVLIKNIPSGFGHEFSGIVEKVADDVKNVT